MRASLSLSLACVLVCGCSDSSTNMAGDTTPTGTSADATTTGSGESSETATDTTETETGSEPVELVAGEVWTITTDLDGGDGLVLGLDGVLYVSEPQFDDIRSVTLDGQVDLFATGFNEDYGMSLGPSGDIYVANWGDQNVIRVSPAGELEIFVSIQGRPGNVFVEPSGDVLVPYFYAGRVERVTEAGERTTIAQGQLNQGLHGLMYDDEGTLYTGYHLSGAINQIDARGQELAFAQLPGQLGNILYFEGQIFATGYNTASVYTISETGEVELFAGNPEPGYVDGPALDARFTNPNGLVADPVARALYVSESGGRVRGIELLDPD